MVVASLGALRAARRNWRRLEAGVPVVLVLAVFGAGGGLAAVAHTNSAVLIAITAAALLVSITGLGGWMLMTDRRARESPSHVTWPDDVWRRFERSFWAHVKRLSELPPLPWPDLDEM